MVMADVPIAVSDLTMFALAFAVRTLMSFAALPTVLFASLIPSRNLSALALRNTTSSPRLPAILPPVPQHALELLAVDHWLLFKNGEHVRICSPPRCAHCRITDCHFCKLDATS